MKRTTFSLAEMLLAPGAPVSAAMTLASHDIAPNTPIPVAQIYPRCGGQNISPQLAWTGAPAGTKSLVLTMIDLDVKPALWSHWIVVDMPPGLTGLPRGVKSPPGRTVASNFGDAAYGGPCPPTGTGVHHYQFTIWAMPTATTSIAPEAKASEIAPTLTKTALAHASLTGWAKR
jgi:hypothetical protein